MPEKEHIKSKRVKKNKHAKPKLAPVKKEVKMEDSESESEDNFTDVKPKLTAAALNKGGSESSGMDSDDEEVVTPTKPAKVGDKRKADSKSSAAVAPRAKQPKISEEELAEFCEFVNDQANNFITDKEEMDKKTLFVKNLPRYVKPSEVKALSKDIVDVRIPRSGSQFVFAYVEFESEKKADKNMKKLKGKTVSDQEIEVDYLGAKSSFKAKKMPKPLDPKEVDPLKLICEGLSPDMDEQELRKFFPKAADVMITAKYSDFAETTKHRGCISFNSLQDTKKAYLATKGNPDFTVTFGKEHLLKKHKLAAEKKEEDLSKLFVRSTKGDINRKALQKIFPTSVDISVPTKPTKTKGNKQKNFAFVSFGNPENMEEAYNTSQGTQGYQISKYNKPEKIKTEKPASPEKDQKARDPFKLHVRSSTTNEMDKEGLKEVFPKSVKIIIINKNKGKGPVKPSFAFVCFENEEDKEDAYNANKDLSEYQISQTKPIQEKPAPVRKEKAEKLTKNNQEVDPLKLFVYSTTQEINKEVIKELFPKSVRVSISAKEKRGRGEIKQCNAFVTFANQQDMESAHAANRNLPGITVKNLYISKKNKDGPLVNLDVNPLKLFVRNYQRHIDEDELKTMFPNCVKVVKPSGGKKFRSDKKTFAYVFFDDEQDTESAYEATKSKKDFLITKFDKASAIEKQKAAASRKEKKDGNKKEDDSEFHPFKLFVHGISQEMDDKDLKKFFPRAVNIYLMKKQNKNAPGSAFIYFKRKADTQKALEAAKKIPEIPFAELGKKNKTKDESPRKEYKAEPKKEVKEEDNDDNENDESDDDNDDEKPQGMEVDDNDSDDSSDDDDDDDSESSDE